MKGPVQVWTDDPDFVMEPLALVAKRYDPGASKRLRAIHDRAREGFVLSLGVHDGIGVLADAAGWTAAVNAPLPPDAPAAAPAWAFAMACAFAKAFGAGVLRIEGRCQEPLHFCLQTFARATRIIDFAERKLALGMLTLLGGGAIGGGFAYVARSDWTGELHVIDSDRYDEPNEETTMLLSRETVLKRAPKAAALGALLKATGRFTCRSTVTNVQAESPVLAEKRDVFIAAVDNPGARLIFDGVNAGLLNGGLGGHVDTAGHVLWSPTRTAILDCRRSTVRTRSRPRRREPCRPISTTAAEFSARA